MEKISKFHFMDVLTSGSCLNGFFLHPHSAKFLDADPDSENFGPKTLIINQ
jgi:hypothetical protein